MKAGMIVGVTVVLRFLVTCMLVKVCKDIESEIAHYFPFFWFSLMGVVVGICLFFFFSCRSGKGRFFSS